MNDYEHLRSSFHWPRPEYFNFATDVFDRWAEQQPHHPALQWVDGKNERIVAFAELEQRSRRVAAMLLNLKLTAHDRVLIALPRVVAWWESLLGILRAGLVACPGTVLLTASDLRYRFECSRAVAIITDQSGAEKADQLCDQLPLLRHKLIVDTPSRSGWTSYEAALQDANLAVPVPRTRASDPAMIYFTSGTTGHPKMVLHSHASYGIGHEVTGRVWLGLQPDDLHWNLSDTGWAKAAWSSFFGPWICGATLFVQHGGGKFQPRDVIHYLTNYPITTFCAPPTVYRMLVQQDLHRFQPARLRDCVAAGEPLNPEVIAVWRDATGITIRDGYGQTETVMVCGNFPGAAVKPGSMGRPAPGFDLAVIDGDGQRLPPAQEGDIAIRVEPERPVGLFLEYLENPAATEACHRDGWYLTGDRARVDDDGYFWFVGRADDVITSSAYRIGPFEVESALLEHPAVAEAAVVGKRDPLRGEIVAAYIVLADGYVRSESLKRELQQHVRHATAPFKYPRYIEFLDELPKTISGKIRRIDLRNRE